MIRRGISSACIVVMSCMVGIPLAHVRAAAPLACIATPSSVSIGGVIVVRATGGIGPYWLDISDRSVVIYTPSKLESKGIASGVWNVMAAKAGVCAFRVKDSTGATATAQVTIKSTAVAPPSLPPLAAVLSNRAPWAGDELSLAVSSGVKPYTVAASPASTVLLPTGEGRWKVKVTEGGAFTLTVKDGAQRTYAIAGVAQVRPMPLQAALDGTRLYWQVRPGSVQKPIRLNVITGNPPYRVQVDSAYLQVQDIGRGAYHITSNGRGGDTTVQLLDAKGQTMTWRVHAAYPLSVMADNAGQQRKKGEGYMVYIHGGEPPYSVRTSAPGAYVSEGLKDKRYAATYFVGNLPIGTHKIHVSDASTSATGFALQCEVTVAP